MPTYMDIHVIPGGVSAEAVAKAHAQDVKVEGKYGVHYHRYWVNESSGKIFCLCDAPSAEAAAKVHAEAHGLLAEKLIEVEPELAEGFLGGGQVDPAGSVLFPGAQGRDPGIRTILFTDIVNSTSLTQTIGDEKAMELLNVHDTIVRDALAALHGREVKHTGDGIMASFASAAAAVRCASQIQQKLTQREKERADDVPLKVRIGGAAGEPVEKNEDIFGTTVQLAARLCSHAKPDQILVSNVVAELCVGKGLAFRPLGEVSLKGFDRPMHVHAVEWPQVFLSAVSR
jgi:class 3 adenylate cyclase